MGQFNDWKNSVSGRNGSGVVEPYTSESLPLLGEALSGVYNPSTKVWESQPHTLTIWLEGTLVKFCLSAGDSHPKFFSSFQGLDSGLEEVEKCLGEKRGDWKQPGARRSR